MSASSYRPGDVVVTPAGELHSHGAVADQTFSHLNVTGGGYASEVS